MNNSDRKSLTFQCVCCNLEHKFSECEALQSYWYEEPYSCNAGDYWHPAEIYIVCPFTDNLNRILFHDKSKDRRGRTLEGQFRDNYSGIFKKIEKYFDNDDGKWYNNTYIEKKYKEYGLKVFDSDLFLKNRKNLIDLAENILSDYKNKNLKRPIEMDRWVKKLSDYVKQYSD